MINVLLLDDIKVCCLVECVLCLCYQVIEVSVNVILIFLVQELDYVIEYVNLVFVCIIGYSSGEVVGKSICFLEGCDSDFEGFEIVWIVMCEQCEYNVVLCNYYKDGLELWNDFYIVLVCDESSVVMYFVVVFYDIILMKCYEVELEFQVSCDMFIGLINCYMLCYYFEQVIGMVEWQKQVLWVVFVDLDCFKFVNDIFGYKVGDILLCIVVGWLCVVVCEVDMVVCLGGDEFIMILLEQDEFLFDICSL